jgi:hypothetical protein
MPAYVRYSPHTSHRHTFTHKTAIISHLPVNLTIYMAFACGATSEGWIQESEIPGVLQEATHTGKDCQLCSHRTGQFLHVLRFFCMC